MRMNRRWLFADQLGPHFLDRPDQPVLLVESKAVFRRRAFHRQKAHLVLSALRHRAAELGDRAASATETYAEARAHGAASRSRSATPRRGPRRELVRRLGVTVLPPRGFVTAPRDFVAWADDRRGALRMEDFYRDARRRHDVLMDGAEPAGGRWNLDADNRQPPPRDTGRLDVAPHRPCRSRTRSTRAYGPTSTAGRPRDIAFVGRDGPRAFPATRAEALARLRHFVDHRLPPFGPYEDAMLRRRPVHGAQRALARRSTSACSTRWRRSARAEDAYRAGAAPLSSVEGFVRQLIGWRDYIWHLYWYFDAGLPRTFNGLGANRAAAGLVRRPGRRRGRGRAACPTCSPASATAAGCTTSRG